ncbi:MAG: hypothetical protein AB1568_04890 [Thermodesulfobacteriota bacterium]
MALLSNGGLLKTSAKYALWGLGIYIGLKIVGPALANAAKPLAKEAGRGYRSLMDKLKGETGEEPDVEYEEGEIEIGEQAVAAAGAGAAMAAAEGAGELAAPAKAVRKRQPRKAAAKTAAPSASWSKEDLYALAQELRIRGRSSMGKKELLAALQAAASPGPA